MERRANFIFLVPVAIALCTAPLMASAQNNPPAAEGAPHAGNIYDYQKHQPTAPTTPIESSKQMDEEVKSLMKQLDELDSTFNQPEGKRPQRR